MDVRLYILQGMHKYANVEELDAKWKQTSFSYLAIQWHFVASGVKRSKVKGQGFFGCFSPVCPFGP